MATNPSRKGAEASLNSPSVTLEQALGQIGFRHLVTVCILFETGNMRKAAEIVGRTQPALSLQIKQLESMVGFQVINHRRGAMAFTPQGRALAMGAEGIIKDFEDLVYTVRLSKRPGLRVGLTEDFFRQDMRDVSGFFLDESVEFNVQCSADLLRKYHLGQLDVVLAKGSAPIRGAWGAWQQDVVWGGVIKTSSFKEEGIRLALLPDSCHYHLTAIRSLERSGIPYSYSVHPGWDGVIRHLRNGGATVVARDWPGQVTVHEHEVDLPRLPRTVINVLATPDASDQCGTDKDGFVARLADRLALPDSQRIL